VQVSNATKISDTQYNFVPLYFDCSMQSIFSVIPKIPFNTKRSEEYSDRFVLVRNEWEKPHESRALDGFCQCALILCREASALSREDAAVRVQESLQVIDVFVIDKANIV
jgi:hypothetical protein